MSVTTTTRIATIADAISAALRPALTATDDHKAAQEASNEANEVKTGARLALMLTCADASLQGSWTKVEIDQACKVVVGRVNDKATAKTVATLTSEIKNAAHPLTRAHAHVIVDVVNNLWDDADLARKADKAASHPMKTCFARRYHAFTGLFKQAAAGNLLATEQDVHRYAVANDPSHDVDRIMKKIENLAAELAAIKVDFDDDDIGMCVDTLGKITKDDLVRASKRGKTVAESVTPVIPTVVENTTEADETRSLLDDILDGSPIELRQAA